MTIRFEPADDVVHMWWHTSQPMSWCGTIMTDMARALNSSQYVNHRDELYVTFMGGSEDLPYPRAEFSSRSIER